MFEKGGFKFDTEVPRCKSNILKPAKHAFKPFRTSYLTNNDNIERDRERSRLKAE